MHNPFKLKTPKEILEREQDRKEIDARIKATVDIAKDILASDKGQKYKTELIEARDSIIEIMIRQVDPDPVKDAFFLRASLNKLSVIYSLLKSIEGDAQGV